MRRVLFVDDEPHILQGLQRLLRPMHAEWEMTFAVGGQAALEHLANAPFDVIVSDMRMPGISGPELMARVMRDYPSIIRIVLSGQSDQNDIMRSISAAHLYLAKPCDPELLKETIARACALKDLMANEATKRVVATFKSLPSPPNLYLAIVKATETPDTSVKEIADIVSQDMAMTAKILQLVNSAYFGFPRQITDPKQAVSLLGTERMKGLVLSSHVFSQFAKTGNRLFNIDDLWHHSMLTATTATHIMKMREFPAKAVDIAFTASLLHDVGRLALAANLVGEYEQVLKVTQDENLVMEEVETEIVGATHAEVGAYLMDLWGLPDTIVEAVAYHHSPARAPTQQFSTTTAVHIADVLAQSARPCNTFGALPKLDLYYVARTGVLESIPEWREHARTMQITGIAL